MILETFVALIIIAAIDVAVKEVYVKKYLWIRKYNYNWGALPVFWRDMIPDDHWYRIRWAIVLNIAGSALAALWTHHWLGAVCYFYLAGINWEHVFYQWLMGFIFKPRRYFDLDDNPAWMEGLPWNRWLARQHGRDVVGSEEILTIAVLGSALLFVLRNAFCVLGGR